jgi:hypothetical protein
LEIVGDLYHVFENRMMNDEGIEEGFEKLEEIVLRMYPNLQD